MGNLGLNKIKYCLRFIPDKLYIQIYYFAKYKKLCCLKEPKTFNEKIQWLKLYDRKELYTTVVDKIEVKKYVEKKIGSQYIIPTLKIWDNVDEIDLNDLPQQFVLKCNHDSGFVSVCNNRSNYNIEVEKKLLKKQLEMDFYLIGREWPYKNVNRRILAEKFMVDNKTSELRDYKLFCFNGKVKCFKIDFDRSTYHRANYYDCKGRILPFGECNCPPDYEKKIEIPNTISKMIELAEILSEGFPFLRVDFYDVDGNVYFGELTLYPASGFGKFTSREWERKFGGWLTLPKRCENE